MLKEKEDLQSQISLLQTKVSASINPFQVSYCLTKDLTLNGSGLVPIANGEWMLLKSPFKLPNTTSENGIFNKSSCTITFPESGVYSIVWNVATNDGIVIGQSIVPKRHMGSKTSTIDGQSFEPPSQKYALAGGISASIANVSYTGLFKANDSVQLYCYAKGPVTLSSTNQNNITVTFIQRAVA